MNKMLVAIFASEAQAYEGLRALKDLHAHGDITLYATAVLSKEGAGQVGMKQAVDEGPVGTALGLFAGSMVGLLAGPVGLALGASLGGLAGAISDLNKSGIDMQFMDDVSAALSPGKVAVLADVEEGWTTPVDTRLGKMGGMVFRRLRDEVAEDQLARESAAFQAEVQQLKQELAEAHAENKAEIQAQIDETKKKAQVIEDQIKARMEQTRREADAKITALQLQIKESSERSKAKIESRIATVKADLAVRQGKLHEANRLTKEALFL